MNTAVLKVNEAAVPLRGRKADGQMTASTQILGCPNQNAGAKARSGELESGTSETMETLALDLGTQTGWALMKGDKIIDSGSVTLADATELVDQREKGQERTGDIRLRRLLGFVQKITGSTVRRIVFEDVIFDRSQAQAQLWASLRTVAWLFGSLPQNVVKCVPVATLKKFATGNGCADKRHMAEALAKADPAQYVLDVATGLVRRDRRLLDDNEVDAIWIARFTAAADRGEADFLSVFERKQAKKLEIRARKAAAKAAKKARKESQAAARRALVATIKGMGKCCGIFRKPAPRNRAICPKCHATLRIPKCMPTVSSELSY